MGVTSLEASPKKEGFILAKLVKHQGHTEGHASNVGPFYRIMLIKRAMVILGKSTLEMMFPSDGSASATAYILNSACITWCPIRESNASFARKYQTKSMERAYIHLPSADILLSSVWPSLGHVSQYWRRNPGELFRSIQSGFLVCRCASSLQNPLHHFFLRDGDNRQNVE